MTLTEREVEFLQELSAEDQSIVISIAHRMAVKALSDFALYGCGDGREYKGLINNEHTEH